MSYFTIPVSAKSEEELERRIADNESKGFELVKTFTKEIEGNDWRNEGYRSGGEPVLRFAGSDYHKSYCAVMRRDNTKYLEEKRRA